jgi:hypothetical protein
LDAESVTDVTFEVMASVVEMLSMAMMATKNAPAGIVTAVEFATVVALDEYALTKTLPTAVKAMYYTCDAAKAW